MCGAAQQSREIQNFYIEQYFMQPGNKEVLETGPEADPTWQAPGSYIGDSSGEGPSKVLGPRDSSVSSPQQCSGAGFKY